MARRPELSGSPSRVAALPPGFDPPNPSSLYESLFAHERTLRPLRVALATGTGNLALSVGPLSPANRAFRLVYLRIHFAGGAGTASVTISLDSAAGSAYDTLLETITARGVNADCSYRISPSDNQHPSPWTFQRGDACLIAWTNPDTGNMTYGAEVGYVED